MMLTGKAAAKLLSISADEGVAPLARASIRGGGCAGFTYDLEFVSADTINPTDEVIEVDGATLLVDSVSSSYFDNCTLDYVEDGLVGTGFKFVDPDVTSTCGCGKSVSF